MEGADDLADLLAASARGDQRAFERLHGLTARRLHGVLLFMLRREDLAVEALQDVFLSVWQHAGQYSPARGSGMAWLARIARNRALDRLAHDAHQSPPLATMLLEALPDEAPGPEAQAMRSEQAGRLLRCLQGLQRMQRLCVYLACVEGLSQPDVATRLQVPVGSAKAWTRRGLTKLRRCLQP